MSYLSTTENVGFSGIPQNISEASCATQYKMAVEGVPGSCNDVNMFINDSSGDEQTYISHLNDNYFHTKFKIDPNDLYTFHDSDVIAEYQDVETTPHIFKETKTSNTKVLKTKTLNQGKDQIRSNSAFEVQKVHSPKGHSSNTTSSSKASIISDNLNSTSTSNSVSTSKNAGETFLDVFKREQGLVVSPPTVIKTEALDPSAPPPLLAAPAPKIPVSGGKKTSAGKTPAAGKTSSGKTPSAGKTPSVGKTPSSGKTPSQSKPRRGRGPAVHEALQRIHTRAVPEPTRTWHAPGHELFDLCPLDSKRPLPFTMESSSSDDDNMPDFEAGTGPVCVEESAAESRGARLALRRAALRRHVARAQTSLKLAKDYRKHRELASKQLQSQKPLGTCRLPTATVNYLLTRHGMPALLTSQEKRLLRESGWSGGESGSTKTPSTSHCSEERCTKSPLPCARYCLKHIAMDPEQRLYASCAAVFAGGARCMQPLLPLQDHTPLCTEHAWKRMYAAAVAAAGPHAALHRARVEAGECDSAVSFTPTASCAAVFAGGARCMQPLLPLQDHTPLCTEHAWKRVSVIVLSPHSYSVVCSGVRWRR
ncbi:putative DNA-binding domain-containing protein [Phthorimaea operculella]|nr:putative DNA-binding domain-containing protein [Phthorimaea operculella]